MDALTTGECPDRTYSQRSRSGGMHFKGASGRFVRPGDRAARHPDCTEEGIQRIDRRRATGIPFPPPFPPPATRPGSVAIRPSLDARAPSAIDEGSRQGGVGELKSARRLRHCPDTVRRSRGGAHATLLCPGQGSSQVRTSTRAGLDDEFRWGQGWPVRGRQSASYALNWRTGDRHEIFLHACTCTFPAGVRRCGPERESNFCRRERRPRRALHCPCRRHRPEREGRRRKHPPFTPPLGKVTPRPSTNFLRPAPIRMRRTTTRAPPCT